MNITTPNNMIVTMLSEMVSKVMPLEDSLSSSMIVFAEGLMGSRTVIFWLELSPNEDGGDGKILMVFEIMLGSGLLLDCFVVVIFLVALTLVVVVVAVVVVVVVVVVVDVVGVVVVVII